MGFASFVELRDSSAHRVYGHLRDVFRFSETDASAMVNEAMEHPGWSGGGPIHQPATPGVPVKFTSHRGKRLWEVRARKAPFVTYTIVEVVETTPKGN